VAAASAYSQRGHDLSSGECFPTIRGSAAARGRGFYGGAGRKKVEEAQQFDSYERYVPELLVLDQRGELVTTLTDSVIELKDMLRLAQLVEAQGDRAVKLFHVPSATAC